MAISTYKVALMHSEDGSSYKKLIDIKDFPDLGGAPELLETTTLSDSAQTFIPGIQTLEAMEFTANYTLEDYKKLEALKNVDGFYSVWFGGTESAGVFTPTGDNGKFNFKGALSVFATGGGVNEVVGMTVTIAPSTVITLSE